MDLTADYSKECLAAAKAGSDAMIAKLDELGITGQDKISEFMLATMKAFSRATAAAYCAAKDREEIEVFMPLFIEAIKQRTTAEIIDIQVSREMRRTSD